MDSNSIVMIAYYFPPEGNAAVYRPLRFLKELVKREWQATVVSCVPYQYERNDPQLLGQIPPTTRVIRAQGRDPSGRGDRDVEDAGDHRRGLSL